MVGYPKEGDELAIVDQYSAVLKDQRLTKLLRKESLIALQQLTRQVLVSDEIKRAVVKLVAKTRTSPEQIEFGASPRASIGLILAAKARALLNGRSYVSGEDIRVMAPPVLRHRIILSFKTVRSGKTADDVIKELIK